MPKSGNFRFDLDPPLCIQVSSASAPTFLPVGGKLSRLQFKRLRPHFHQADSECEGFLSFCQRPQKYESFGEKRATEIISAVSTGGRALIVWTHLQEPRDVSLVVDAHGNHVLEHPEERPVLSFFGLGLAQQAVELEEQPPCAFWSNNNAVSGSSRDITRLMTQVWEWPIHKREERVTISNMCEEPLTMHRHRPCELTMLTTVAALLLTDGTERRTVGVRSRL